MKILLYFFARYLLAPLFVAVMIFVLTGIKTIKSKLSLKKLIIFILLASIAVALPSLFGFLKNEYVWGGLTFTILSYILLGALFCKLSTSDLFGAIGIGSSRTAVILTLTTICALGGWCYYLLFELISKLPYSLWNTTNILWFAIPYLIMYSVAEASMLGWNTGISAEDAYNKAVTYSMEENSVSAEDIADYLANAGKFTNDKKQIYYEEWVAMFKQGMEGWSLYRRTGVPDNLYPAPGRPANYS